jgi:hypothetical protein
MERLCEHIEYRDVHVKFFIYFFDIFKKIFKIKSKNREHILPSAKTPLPLNVPNEKLSTIRSGGHPHSGTGAIVDMLEEFYKTPKTIHPVK